MTKNFSYRFCLLMCTYIINNCLVTEPDDTENTEEFVKSKLLELKEHLKDFSKEERSNHREIWTAIFTTAVVLTFILGIISIIIASLLADPPDEWA